MQLSLSQISAIENDRQLWQFSCPKSGIPLWPTVRVAFFREIISDLVYDQPIAKASVEHPSLMKGLGSFIRGVNWNRKLINQRDWSSCVLYTTDTIADTTRDNCFHNRLTDNFAEITRGSLTLLDQHTWGIPFPRHNESILLHFPVQVRNFVATRICSALAGKDKESAELVELFLVRAKAILGWHPAENRKNWMYGFAQKKSRSLHPQLSAYRRLFARISPKVIVGCAIGYGPLVPMLVAARERGIKIVEYQHGAISAGHDAYNFGDASLNFPELKMMLPDTFLLYGEWWGQQINSPVPQVVIGNPARPKSRATDTDNTGSQAVLILGDGIDTEKYLTLASELAKQLFPKGIRTIFRPHPLERSSIAGIYSSGEYSFEIDQSPSIHEAFKNCTCVISEISTGLFDALGRIDRIFAWRTPKSYFSFPKLPFEEFKTADELVALVQNPQKGRVAEELTPRIWAENWEERYQKFIQSIDRNIHEKK